MNDIYIRTRGINQWRGLLQKKGNHWKKKYSAAMLATSWARADGFPLQVAKVFRHAGDPFATLCPLLIFPEHAVKLPGGNGPSQSDAWVLAKGKNGLASIAVEGKLSEVLGPTLTVWQAKRSTGKAKRLAFLKNILGLPDTLPGVIRYQLIHRTASALIEAKRFDARMAILLVHSFSPADEGFGDYNTFVELFKTKASPDRVCFLGERDGIQMHAVWVRQQVFSS